MATKGVSLLKFVGTVSLGLLTGVSYTVSALALPSLLHLPSTSSAAHVLATMTSALRLPVLSLTTLSSVPLLLSFFLSPRAMRHPYLLYTSLLAVLSFVGPAFLPPSVATTTTAAKSSSAAATQRKRKQHRQQQASRDMEASYEVLDDAASAEPISEEEADEGVNEQEIRAEVDFAAKGYLVRTGVAAMAFTMAVLGIWGDGAPQAVVYVA